ncbi:hypothetical protein ACPCTO_32040 [Streptomyces olivoreticuli]
MNTQPQPPKRALAREAVGLLLISFGALGALFALGLVHWALGLTVGMVGLVICGVRTVSSTKTLRQHVFGTAVAIVGYGGLTGCAFSLYAPLGWLAVSAAVIAAGVWLASEGA